MGAVAVLVGLALWAAWAPAETVSATPAVVAAALLALLPWAWRRTSGQGLPGLGAGLLTVLVVLAVSALSGPEPAAGIRVLVLLVAAVPLTFMASRERPTPHAIEALALGLAALALWGAWQVAFGLERALDAVPDMPEGLRAGALERLEGGRAFASQLLPSHLAVLLATAMPLLAAGLRQPRLRWGSWVGLTLCLMGILLSRSPVGAALAVAALAAVLPRRRRAVLVALVAGGLLVAVGAVWLREDVARLEPLALRVDNWRSALWVWSRAPLAGVGLGGFGQVAQLVPFQVGNRPAHAHCLPLEFLAELGPAGLAGVALAAAALARLLLKLWPGNPELAAALAVVPLHNLVDFSFFVSGVALPWAVLLGWGVALARAREDRGPPPQGRAVAVGVTASVLLLAALHGTSVVMEDAAAAEQRPAVRYERAWSAWRTAPWRVQPALLVAVSALELGDRDRCDEAAQLLDRVAWWRPRSAVVASLQSRLAVRRGDVAQAVASAWLATRRRPFDPRPKRELEAMLGQLEAPRHDPR